MSKRYLRPEELFRFFFKNQIYFLIVEIYLFCFLYFLSVFIRLFFPHADTYWHPRMHSRHTPHVQSHSGSRVSRQENRIQNWRWAWHKNEPAAVLERKKNHGHHPLQYCSVQWIFYQHWPQLGDDIWKGLAKLLWVDRVAVSTSRKCLKHAQCQL